MAYTIGRLEKAKRIFRNPNLRLIRNLADGIEVCKYSLRKRNVSNIQTPFPTWIDNDDTGDYDPKHDTITKRKRPPRGEDSGAARLHKRAKTPESLIATMSLKSDAGKAFLASLTMSEEDSPYMCDDQWMKYWDVPGTTSESALETRYSFRTRDNFPKDRSPIINLEVSPARGCWSCRELRHECSILDHPQAYPCQACQEDDIDCEPIIPPTWKRACENCKRSRKACSYNHGDTDHSLPCRQCRALGIHCVAGPAKHQPLSKPMIIDDKDIGESIPAIASSKPAESTSQPPLVMEDEAIDSLFVSSTATETVQSNNNATRIIQTSLAHPVNFAYEPPEDGSNPCHWCSNFAYGITGLGRRTVEVIDFADGKYIEVQGGHVSQGHEPSRMCVTCALERIHIMTCPGHRIIPLKAYNPGSFDFEAAYDSLVRPPKMINPWCVLCPNPAFFGCSTVQSVNKYQEPVDASSPEAKGCGMLLCERCELLMRAYRGDLFKVVAKNEEASQEFGSRADVVFLLPGNDLYRVYTGS